MNTVVRYCWLCDQPVRDLGRHGGGYADRHYETGRVVFFCSREHWDSYSWLKAL